VRKIEQGSVSYGGQGGRMINMTDLYQYNPFWSPDDKYVAFEASQNYTQVKPDGLAVPYRGQGVWVFSYSHLLKSQGQLRRLATDAQIVGWL
jgi:Tol biopolymer transport system component